MYEISRYMSVNTLGTASLLQAMLDRTKRGLPAVEKLVVASSMSIYGEGNYACSSCGRSASPPVRAVDQLRRGEWDLRCGVCDGVLVPRPTGETKPSEINSMYALSKRDQEELCLIYGRPYGLPVRGHGLRQSLALGNAAQCGVAASPGCGQGHAPPGAG